MSMHAKTVLLPLTVAAFLAAGGPVFANQRSETLRREGYAAAYNLDYDRAVELFNQATAADPNDAAACRGAAAVAWSRILFLRGTVLVEDYLGHIRTSSDIQMPAPPPALETTFHQNVDRAIAIAEREVDQHYNDATSHYDLSAAVGLYASYAGTVEGRMFAAMKLARRAVSESEMVQSLDPLRKDAGLIGGTYRYLVSGLPAPLRVLAYIVGFSGGKEEAFKLIEGAAAYPGDVQPDAQFALVLLYNRERRYAEAITVIRSLERSFPENRLLLLEEGSTFLRAKRPADALKALDQGFSRLAEDRRPRMPGEEGRWLYKRGAARLQVGRLDEAEADLKAALAAKDVQGWVQVRVRVELGKVADLRGDRAKAMAEYKSALAMAKRAPDREAEEAANALLVKRYVRE
jgi:tetratricopeptide (TPR) repeat protein